MAAALIVELPVVDRSQRTPSPYDTRGRRSSLPLVAPNAPGRTRTRTHSRNGSIDNSSAAIRTLSEFSALAACEAPVEEASPVLVPIAWAPADSPLIEDASVFARRTSMPVRRARHSHTSSIGSSAGTRSSIQSMRSSARSSVSTCPSTPGLESPGSSAASSTWSPFSAGQPRWSAPRGASLFAKGGLGFGESLGEEDDECEMLDGGASPSPRPREVVVVAAADDDDSAHRLGAMMLQSPTLGDEANSPLHTPLVGLDAPFVLSRKSSSGSIGPRTPRPPRVDSLPTRGLFG